MVAAVQGHLESGGHASGSPAGRVERRVGRQTRQENGELVSVESDRQRTPRPDGRCELGGDVPEHGVPDGVAVNVVDLLEAVEVEQQDPDRAAALAAEGAPEPVDERFPVR